MDTDKSWNSILLGLTITIYYSYYHLNLELLYDSNFLICLLTGQTKKKGTLEYLFSLFYRYLIR